MPRANYGDMKCTSNFWVICGGNPIVWPSKWNLFSSTFAWYHLFFNILQNKIWDFSWTLFFGTLGSYRVIKHCYHLFLDPVFILLSPLTHSASTLYSVPIISEKGIREWKITSTDKLQHLTSRARNIQHPFCSASITVRINIPPTFCQPRWQEPSIAILWSESLWKEVLGSFKFSMRESIDIIIYPFIQDNQIHPRVFTQWQI